MAKQRKILIIGANYYQKYIYDKAIDLGLKVHSVDGNPDAPLFKLCHDYENIDIFDVANICKYARANKIDAVTTMNIDQGMIAVSKIQKELDLPFKSIDAVTSATRKDLMRNIWRDNNVNIPDYWVFDKEQESDAIKLFKNSKRKFIVKPVDNAAKRGISIIYKKDKRINNKIANAFLFSKMKRIIIEEFIEGDLYFAPTYLTSTGQSIVYLIRQFYTDNLVQIKYKAPANLKESVANQIMAEAQKAILPFGMGPYHTEILYSKSKGPIVVETSPRLSYATVALTRLIEKFDPVIEILSDALKTNFDNNLYIPSNANVATLEHLVPKPGKVFNGNASSNNVPNIYELCPVVNPGHKVNEFTTNGDRVFYFVAFAETERKLEEIARCYRRKLLEKCFD